MISSRMRSAALLLQLVILLAASAPASAADLPDYIGEWSNGRGESLVITAKTLQFDADDPVPYRDITRATDGNYFQLEITASDDVNAFAGKFLGVTCDGEEMKIVQYSSASDLQRDANPQGEITWFRDDAE